MHLNIGVAFLKATAVDRGGGGEDAESEDTERGEGDIFIARQS